MRAPAHRHRPPCRGEGCPPIFSTTSGTGRDLPMRNSGGDSRTLTGAESETLPGSDGYSASGSGFNRSMCARISNVSDASTCADDSVDIPSSKSNVPIRFMSICRPLEPGHRADDRGSCGVHAHRTLPVPGWKQLRSGQASRQSVNRTGPPRAPERHSGPRCRASGALTAVRRKAFDAVAGEE